MEILETSLPGCKIIKPRMFLDDRGLFVKTFQKSFFDQQGIETEFKEQYFSSSKKGVIRGMHFQTPPHEHHKLVFCITGSVLDVVIDLRKNSPTYGQTFSIELSAENFQAIYIPHGLAHGFCSLSENSTLVYNVSSEYCAAHDAGIHWQSISFNWPINNPIISARDDLFLPLSSFQSPFLYT